MKYQIGKQYHGFTLQQKDIISEIQSTVYIFTHVKTKARLVAIKNDDQNKTFTVSYQTLPDDSTGAAHIIEHSVLSGSKKYPVKDLFEELMKGGLMTFLNAMTSSDETVFPFATRNEKEYFNLMDIYMDVTLNPLLDEETFLQEGWHFELMEPDAPLKFKGVVYNEMKGAYSDPFRLIYRAAYSALMPNSTYSVDSGGIPENIPELSYDQFKAFWEKFYHPTNSVIGLYGDADLDKELLKIDENFLSKADYKKMNTAIVPGDNIRGFTEISTCYAVNPNDPVNERTFFTICSKLGHISDYKNNMAFEIIGNLLFESDASPLKKAFLEAGVGKDLSGFFNGEQLNTSMFTVLVGADSIQKEAFKSLYYETLNKICEEGFDKDLITSELNSVEFGEREKSLKSQRGLNYLRTTTSALFYGIDPLEGLKFDTVFGLIREEALNDRYFEKLIKEYLIDNSQTILLTAEPDPQKNTKTAEIETKKLQAFRETLSQDELNGLVKTTQDLLIHQSTANSPEKLSLLPRLTISDIPNDIPIKTATVEKHQGVPCIYTDIYTNAITYLNIGLDVSALPTVLLPYLKLFSNIVTEIGTTTRDYTALAKEIATFTGGLGHDFSNHIQLESPTEFHPIQWFNVKILRNYLPRATELIADIFKNVAFTDRTRIRQIVERNYTWAEQSIRKGGTGIPTSRVGSYLSDSGKYSEAVGGITSFFALKEIACNYKENEERFISTLNTIKDILFNRESLTFSVTADAEDIKTFDSLSPLLIASFGEEVHSPETPAFKSDVINEAFLIPAEIVFAIQGGKLFESGLKYSGKFEVLKSVLSHEYLHNLVRAKGGAYGVWIESNPLTGSIFFVSYRDPNVADTYKAYNNIPSAIQNLSIPEEAMEQWIIRTFGKFDPLLSPSIIGLRARNDLLSGITPAYRRNRIREIKSTTLSDLQAMAPNFAQLMKNPYRSIIGNKTKIESTAELFHKLIEV